MQPAITRACAAECTCGGGGEGGGEGEGGGSGGKGGGGGSGGCSGGEGGDEGGEDAGVPPVTDNVLATSYHALKLCTTKALMVTLLAVDEGVKDRRTAVLAPGSVWPNPQPLVTALGAMTLVMAP